MQQLIHLRTLYVGPDELLVVAKIGVAAETTSAEVSSAIDQIERDIRSAVPHARYISIEPDLIR